MEKIGDAQVALQIFSQRKPLGKPFLYKSFSKAL